MKDAALFERIGGDALRTVITDFYARIVRDVMIGYMFADIVRTRGRAHLVEREWELVAALLGAPGVTYAGRPMRAAHARHPIFGGHFERRMQVLRETLADHHVDAEVQRVWLEHSLSLRSQLTGDRGSECKDTGEGGREVTPPPPSTGPIKLGRRG